MHAISRGSGLGGEVFGRADEMREHESIKTSDALWISQPTVRASEGQASMQAIMSPPSPNGLSLDRPLKAKAQQDPKGGEGLGEGL